MKVLITGLPGSGKTTLATTLKNHIEFLHLNADAIRDEYNDWDFSVEGRSRQASRMFDLAKSHNGLVIADFVAPTDTQRSLFAPDVVIWMNTIALSIYENTNQLYIPPTCVDLELNDFSYDSMLIANFIKNELDKWSFLC